MDNVDSPSLARRASISEIRLVVTPSVRPHPLSGERRITILFMRLLPIAPPATYAPYVKRLLSNAYPGGGTTSTIAMRVTS